MGKEMEEKGEEPEGGHMEDALGGLRAEAILRPTKTPSHSPLPPPHGDTGAK